MLTKEDKVFFCKLAFNFLTFLVVALGESKDRDSWFNCYMTTQDDIMKLAE